MGLIGRFIGWWRGRAASAATVKGGRVSPQMPPRRMPTRNVPPRPNPRSPALAAFAAAPRPSRVARELVERDRREALAREWRQQVAAPASSEGMSMLPAAMLLAAESGEGVAADEGSFGLRGVCGGGSFDGGGASGSWDGGGSSGDSASSSD